jgi:hypothetical protein
MGSRGGTLASQAPLAQEIQRLIQGREDTARQLAVARSDSFVDCRRAETFVDACQLCADELTPSQNLPTA